MADEAVVATILAGFPEQAVELGIDAALVGSLLDSGLSVTKTNLSLWRTFAGKVAALVDISESGSSRQNGVLFDRAKQMVEYWQQQVTVEDTLAGTLPPRAHGASHKSVRV